MALTATEKQKRYAERHPDRVAAYRASERYRINAAARTARYRAKHPEKIAAYKASQAKKDSDARYREKHGVHPQNDSGTDAYKKYRASEKYIRTHTNAQLSRVYGITLYEYERMLRAQGGVCKICLGTNPKTPKRRQLRPLFVDHCHKSGKVRGLLCVRCNYGIGAFLENPAAMERAIAYLKENNNF